MGHGQVPLLSLEYGTLPHPVTIIFKQSSVDISIDQKTHYQNCQQLLPKAHDPLEMVLRPSFGSQPAR